MNNYLKQAERFLLDCLVPIAHSYDTKTGKWVKPYPEVTGYILSYFATYYDEVPEVVFESADYLLSIQNPNGGFPSFDFAPILYTFDTGQVMHGFLSLYKRENDQRYLDAAYKCIDFIMKACARTGEILPLYNLRKNCYMTLGKGFYEQGKEFAIQAKNIEGIKLFLKIAHDEKIEKFYKELITLSKVTPIFQETHPLGYYLEGMFACGEFYIVKNKLASVIQRIKMNGFISYGEDIPYAYVSGSAQLAILLWKSGKKTIAKLILDWLRKVQENHNSGGLFQYANEDGSINKDVHSEINSWGTKYFCELERLIDGTYREP